MSDEAKKEIIWLVEGEHWSTPPIRLVPCRTEEGAKAQAVKLLNLMEKELKLRLTTDPEGIKAGLEAVNRMALKRGGVARIEVWSAELEP